jgi:glutamate racemase
MRVPIGAARRDPELPIGVFDSGVGGLTVLRAVRAALPHESAIYLGDTARVPYGTKSRDSVLRYSLQASHQLVQRGIKLLVVACNTVSALSLPELRAELAPLPVLGVVEPGAEAAVAASVAQRHLVLATEATVAQRAYTRAIRALAPRAEVAELACSLFVALAEEGWTDGAVAAAAAHAYLGSVAAQPARERPDSVILGCTHFPLLADAIRAELGAGPSIVDSATATARGVAALLERDALATPARSARGDLRLLVTDGAARFARLGSRFLGETLAVSDVEVVDL